MTQKKRRRSIISIIVVVAVAAAIVAGILIQRAGHEKAYAQAVELALEGNWKDSIDTFESLSKGDYRSSGGFYQFCRALKIYDEGDTSEARYLLRMLNDSDFTDEERKIIKEFKSEIEAAYNKEHRTQYTPKPSNSNESSSGNNNTTAGTTQPAATKPPTTASKDPYKANEFAHPDDFYYHYVDDFWEYEDAEEYFYEHHD